MLAYDADLLPFYLCCTSAAHLPGHNLVPTGGLHYFAGFVGSFFAGSKGKARHHFVVVELPYNGFCSRTAC